MTLSGLDTLFMPCLRPGCEVDAKLPWMRWGEGGGMSFSRESLMSRDHLVLCDNMVLLRALPDSCIDLAYIDPPFGTGKKRTPPNGSSSIEGFDDTMDNPEEFVDWLAPRLEHLWRVLAAEGSLVIHLDPRTIHYVRIWCDRELGRQNWENEIIWHYTGGGRSHRRFSRKHDVLLWYSKSPERTFNIDNVREPYKETSGYARGGIVSRKGKKYMPHPHGTPVDDVWDIPIVNPISSERTEYPTQKPLKLLERIISALSDRGDLVCDVFSGSGTTAVACVRLGRRFLCCDNNPDAIRVTMERLQSEEMSYRPALLSHGFYRLPCQTSETVESAGARFSREVLRGLNRADFAMLSSPWLYPGDFVLKVNSS